MLEMDLDRWVSQVMSDVEARLDRAEEESFEDRFAAVDDVARFMAGRGGDDED